MSQIDLDNAIGLRHGVGWLPIARDNHVCLDKLNPITSSPNPSIHLDAIAASSAAATTGLNGWRWFATESQTSIVNGGRLLETLESAQGRSPADQIARHPAGCSFFISM